MANPASREQLKQYALRILGKPVIEINVDDDQLEDRLDEALQYFAQYHYDGVERTYLKYKVTQADVDRQTTDVEAQTSSKTASKVTNTFTGDGTTSVFTLGTAADNAAALTVKLDGVANTAFTVSGTTLTMTEGAVPNGVAIEVTIQNTVSTPWGFLRSTPILLRPLARKSVLFASWPTEAERSTRITSAPISANIMPQKGPGPIPCNSITRTPSSGPITSPQKLLT